MIGIPLAEVVDSYILAQESDVKHKFPIYMEHAKKGLDIFHRQATGALKVKKLEVKNNGTADLPKGFIKAAALFLVTRDGRVIGLTQNDNIRTITDQCGDIVNVGGFNYYWGYDDVSSARHYVNGHNVGGYYGIGGRSVAGTYRINKEAGRVELSSTIHCPYLVLEYIGRPEMVGNDYVVHPYLVNALHEYIHYSSMKFKSNADIRVVDYWDTKWVYSLLQGIVDINGLTAQQTLDAVRKNDGLYPKF